MRSVRSFFLTLASLTLIGIVALFTASLTVLVAGFLGVILIGQALAAFLSPAPQPVRVKPRPARNRQNGDLRVWNDGKGTIIDM